MFGKSKTIERVPRSTGTLYRRRFRQNWPKDRDFRILSIDGGGIRGILPLAFLAELERRYLQGNSVARHFDLIAGTSTGGIIALGLAKGMTANDLLKIYTERGKEVFPDLNLVQKLLWSAAGYFVNRCDTEKLYKLIDEIVGETKLWESQRRICIPSAETRHLEPFIFKTPHHPDYKLDYKQDMSFIAKTTSAAPGHFRFAEGGDGFEFIDGGVWANNPSMVAVADALSCFDINREQIRLLSLGCGRSDFEMSWTRKAFGGLLFWAKLILETMHIQSHNVIGQCRLICGGDRVLRVDPFLRNAIPLWDWRRSRDELPKIGAEFVDSIGSVVESSFFQDEASPLVPIYTDTNLPT